MRDRFDIDADIVWDAAMRDVPLLKPAVHRLLEDLERELPGQPPAR